MKWLKISGILALLIICLIVFMFPTELFYKLAINKARFSAGLSQKEINIDDHRIVYLERKSGEETLVLLHGFGAEKDNWAELARHLKGYRLIIPDLPGFGDSEKIETAEYDIASQVERLDKFFTKIGLKKFYIAGNSMGGNIAGIYSVKHPDKIKALILLNNSGIISADKSMVMKLIEKGDNPLIVKDRESFKNLFKFLFVKQPDIPERIMNYLADRAVEDRAFNEKIFIEMIKKPAMLDNSLALLTMPVLIIWGDKDQILDVSGVRVLEKGIKNHTTKILKDCGHVPLMERPEETASYISEFIAATK